MNAFPSARQLLAAALLMAGLVGGSAHAAPIVVSGLANIFGAGHGGAAATPSPDGGGGGIAPPSFDFAAGPGQVITVTGAVGIVSCCSGASPNGPDGGTGASGNTDILSHNGISGITHASRTMFLVGVFTSDTEPSDPAPPRLDAAAMSSFFDVFVDLDQTFFIGDGLTGEGSGSTQRFHVPAGATHLYLGFADAFAFGNPTNLPGWYDDNTGTLSVELSIGRIDVPEPPLWALLGAALLGVGAARRRR